MSNNAMHRIPTRVTPRAWSLRSRHESRHRQASVIADVRKKYEAIPDHTDHHPPLCHFVVSSRDSSDRWCIDHEQPAFVRPHFIPARIDRFRAFHRCMVSCPATRPDHLPRERQRRNIIRNQLSAASTCNVCRDRTIFLRLFDRRSFERSALFRRPQCNTRKYSIRNAAHSV